MPGQSQQKTIIVAIVNADSVPLDAVLCIIHRKPAWVFIRDPSETALKSITDSLRASPPENTEDLLSLIQLDISRDDDVKKLLIEVSMHHDTDEEAAQLELHGIARTDAIVAALDGWEYVIFDYD